ncbi:MAG: ankyrin repeat domain-containing protein [Candidatus Wallbacteria bacterium]|nr:ankyrin repeat domain-containing protein [Candidatus Wallbacteria bacterium]
MFGFLTFLNPSEGLTGFVKCIDPVQIPKGSVFLSLFFCWLLFSAGIHAEEAVNFTISPAAVEQTRETSLAEQIATVTESGEAALLGSIDSAASLDSGEILAAFCTGCKTRRPAILKHLLGRAEFPARDFSKESDPDLYSLLNDSQDEELLSLLLRKGAVKLHPEMVPAILGAELAAQLKLESWNRKTDKLSPLCFVKSPEVAQYLIDRGFSPDGFRSYNTGSFRPLDYTARMDVAQVLIRNGAVFRMPVQFNFGSDEISIFSWDQHPLLRTKSMEVARLLISEGCGWELPDWHGDQSISQPTADPALLKLLLDQGISPNISDTCGIPILFNYTSSTAEARIMLEHGANPKVRMPVQAEDISASNLYPHMDTGEMGSGLAGKQGYTLMHCAGNGDFVRLMLEYGLDPNQRGGQRNETPLHTVTDPGAISALIEAGADVNARDDQGNTPLFNKNLKPEGLKLLLSHGADPDALNTGGQNVLEMHPEADCREFLQSCCKVSIQKGDETAVKKDLSLSSVLNFLNREKGLSNERKIALVNKCLNQEGIKITDNEGRDLLWACPSPEVARMMEQKGYNLKENVVIIMADAVSEGGHEDLVRYLLEIGMPELMADDKGRPMKDGTIYKSSPLMRCNSEYIDMLVRAGFLPDSTNYSGITPLMEAVKFCDKADRVKQAEKLIADGADVNHAGIAGWTPLHYLVVFFASRWQGGSESRDVQLMDRSLEMLRCLRNAGADPRLKDNRGRTALDLFRNDCRGKGVPEEGKVDEMVKLLQ